MEEQQITIRQMTIEDYDAIYQLWLQTPGMGLNDVDDSREGLHRYLCRNPKTCFVAVMKKGIVGVILAGHDGRRGYIHHTAVVGNLQKQGFGTQLVEHALAALLMEGISKVALVVFQHNEKGTAFWQKQGFTLREDVQYRNKALKELIRMDI